MNAPEFTPTHRVVAAGAHDADGRSLDPHLPVEVREITSGWAAVRCSNGWETWVGATSLEPLVERRRVRPMVVMAAIAAVAVVVGVIALRGGGSSDGELKFPASWATSPDGRSGARQAADLSAAVPSGPRVRVEPSADIGMEAALFSLTEGSPASLAAAPATTTVGGRPAITVEVVERVDGVDVHRIYLLLRDGDAALMYVLEAPESQWATGSGGELKGILDASR